MIDLIDEIWIEEILKLSNEDMQLCIAEEEMSELIKEICKYKRDPNKTKHYDFIKEELADVMIMCLQVQKIFEIPSSELAKEISYKIERTLERLENAE